MDNTRHTADDDETSATADQTLDLSPSEHADTAPMARGDEALLATPLDDTDLDARLSAAGGEGRARSTTILAAIALVVVGLAIGVIAGAAITDMRHNLEAQAEAAAFVPPPDANAPDATGTIRAWDGNDVVVALGDGSIVRATIAPVTALQAVSPAQREDFPPGTEVQLFGTFDAQGVLEASALAQAPAR